MGLIIVFEVGVRAIFFNNYQTSVLNVCFNSRVPGTKNKKCMNNIFCVRSFKNYEQLGGGAASRTITERRDASPCTSQSLGTYKGIRFEAK